MQHSLQGSLLRLDTNRESARGTTVPTFRKLPPDYSKTVGNLHLRAGSCYNVDRWCCLIVGQGA